jgi:hypothetical protein
MRFDLDMQRAVVCLVGLVGLVGQAIVYYVFKIDPSELLTGAFLAMALGPLADSTLARYRDYKDRQPPRPPDGGEGAEGDDEVEEETFRSRHGYYELRAA